jgi:hypothetical protein
VLIDATRAGRQCFDRDPAAEDGVLSLIDHTHPAFANLSDDPVMRNSLAQHIEVWYFL